MNLFQSGCLGCLAQTYLHIYFNKLCTMGTTKQRQTGESGQGRVNQGDGTGKLGLRGEAFLFRIIF